MKSFRNIGVLLLLSMSIFLAVIDLFVVNVAVPSIKESLNGTNSERCLLLWPTLCGYASFSYYEVALPEIDGNEKVYAWGCYCLPYFLFLWYCAGIHFKLNIFRFSGCKCCFYGCHKALE